MTALSLPALPDLPVNRSFTPRYAELVAVAPGIRRIVARNPSPFTFHGTGTYVVGEGAVAVIDPGPDDPAHIAALMEGLGAERVVAILVTHTHLDHSPGARLLKALTGAPIQGCAPHGVGSGSDEEAAVEEGGDLAYRPDVRLREGERVSGPGWTLTALATPGHTANHLCFRFAEAQAVFPGDHVMGWSTTVVAPPDGDMAAYMASLERLAALEARAFYPTHGRPIGGPDDDMGRDPIAFVRALIAHRRAREAQIRAVLADGPKRIGPIVALLYAGVDSRLHGAAARSVLAHLLAMRAAGMVDAEGPAGPAAVYRLT